MAIMKKKLSRGDLLVWKRNPKTNRPQIFVYDQFSSSRGTVAVQLRSRGLFKRAMRQVARFFDWLAY